VSAVGPLVILSPMPGRRAGRSIRLSRKFVTGLESYARAYPGEVQAILIPGEDVSSLDAIDVDLDSACFDVDALPFDGAELRRRLLAAGVVLGMPHHQLHDLPSRLRERGVPYVLCTEYTLRTRLEIVRAEVKNPLRAARRAIWELGQEARLLRAMRHVSALQCNGTPTYEAYRNFVDDSLLYFDNRVEASMIPSAEAVRRRVAGSGDRALRLVYSGRLHPMKGVDHLPEVAAALMRRDVPFELHVFGEGPLGSVLRERVRHLGLEDRVVFHGVVDFASQLVPFVREGADLFVCCHTQGDPSCTYVETLACGVPIVGYDNEAFGGILRDAGRVGVAAPKNDPEAVAKAIERYSRDRRMLLEHSLEALSFASKHLFEQTFGRRAEHLERLATAAPRLSLTSARSGRRRAPRSRAARS
jgi:colanic acid/amylovoran biosynthesis glycosyltransferase